eukprot:GHVS01057520.1.p1 GENE.GHVS01057520.1~~GHVS01057520.1.p1  ORF type:complete len:791 (+),score=98.42 GHVS01057520.1:407-2779(+)
MSDSRQQQTTLSCAAAEPILSVYAKMDGRVVILGLAVFYAETHKVEVCEVRDNHELAILESVIVQVRARECIVNTDVKMLCDKILDLLDSCQVTSIQRNKDYFDVTYLEHDISHLLSDKSSAKTHLAELSMSLASGAMAAVIKECGLKEKPEYFQTCRLSTFAIASIMRLDKAAFNALAILPNNGEGKGGTTSSCCLYGLLNKCKTSLGSRRLLTWVTQPLVDVNTITDRLTVVELLVNHSDLRHIIHGNHLMKVPDLDKLAGALHASVGGGKSRVKLDDLVRLYDCVVEAGCLFSMLTDKIKDNSSSRDTQMTKEESGGWIVFDEMICKPLGDVVKGLDRFLKLVTYTVDMQEAKAGNFVISRQFDPTLKQLAEQRDSLRHEMEKHKTKVEQSLFGGCRRSGGDDLRLVSCSSHGFLFRVTKKDQAAVQKHKGLYEQVRINKGEYLFTNRKLRELAEAHEDSSREYEKQQAQLFAKTLSVARTFWPAVECLAAIIATLDIVTAFAYVAASNNYCKPTLREELQRGDGYFIANDVNMDIDTSRLHIITGPNMGGKSTYIRQVAMVAVMAQIGCFVPCSAAILPIFHHIMCRVGASDNQIRGVSTFMSEMVETSVILKSSTERSLVVVDELGRGTSTYDGFGLAWAIARALTERIKCFCLFATHFHEMAELVSVCPGVVNKHVTACASGDQLTFLYKTIDGCADQSYGTHVAEIARLPAKVIAHARRRADQLELAERLGHEEGRLQLGRLQSLWSKISSGLENEQDFANRVIANREEIEQIGQQSTPAAVA